MNPKNIYIIFKQNKTKTKNIQKYNNQTQNNPDLNIKDSEGMTAIVHAIDKKQKEVVKTLIARKADLNVMDGGTG